MRTPSRIKCIKTEGGESVTERKICEILPHARISYPEFTPDGDAEAAAAQRMNGFYRALRDSAVAFVSTLSGASCLYTADYTSQPHPDGTCRIAYTLRLRRRGRTAAQKSFCHRWGGGVLLPPRTSAHRTARSFFQKRS